MGIILEDANANAALLASSIVMEKFSIFLFNKEGSKLFFAFFLAGC